MNAKRVVYLSHPRQLFLKLYWEIGNLREALSGQPHQRSNHEIAAYHAYNVAVTAWHLTDWSWNFISQESRVQLATELGFEIKSKPLEDLKSFQQAIRKKSRHLEICWDLANGSKHLETHKDSKVETKLEWEGKLATVGELRAGQPLQTFTYDFKVRWENEEHRVLEVFEEVGRFWHGFLSRLGLVDDTLPQWK